MECGTNRHVSLGRFIDPSKFKWKTGCYIPMRSSWFWGEPKDQSKSKCGCFLVDESLRAGAEEACEAGDEHTLCGRGSEVLASRLAHEAPGPSKFATLFDFFRPPRGVSNLGISSSHPSVGPFGNVRPEIDFGKKSNCPRRIPVEHSHRLEELNFLIRYLVAF